MQKLNRQYRTLLQAVREVSSRALASLKTLVVDDEEYMYNSALKAACQARGIDLQW